MSGRERASHLSVDEMRSLDHWCSILLRTFDPCTVYLVGSCLECADYRDVDLRIVVNDDAFDRMPMNVRDLDMLLTQWGKQQTGLPIDCQFQGSTAFSTTDPHKPRNPRGFY